MKGTKAIVLGVGAAAAVLALTPLASGHAVVSAIQPQGKALTSARTAYVLRVPNEKAAQNTFDVIMTVPQAAQTRIFESVATDCAVPSPSSRWKRRQVPFMSQSASVWLH